MIFFQLIFSIFCLPLIASSLHHHEGEHIGWISMYSLPEYVINQRFQSVKEQVNYRWDILAKQYEFPLYSFDKEKNALINEFYTFSQLRVQLWFDDCKNLPCQSNPFFQVSQDLLLKGRFRQPNCLSFAHSVTDTSYNSTCIQIGKRRFFALEGPTEEHVPYFFRLLTNWKVSFIVCLTNEADNQGTPKCFPYWKDRIITKQDSLFLRIPIEGTYEMPPLEWGKIDVPYLFWPDWEDHHGVNPQQLVKAVNHVRKCISNHEIIAVHCSAGVGRTGTFIAAVCLLDAIDEQIANGIDRSNIQLNIAKLFFYLNFHRPWLIAKPAQYITLYRLVDWYLTNI